MADPMKIPNVWQAPINPISQSVDPNSEYAFLIRNAHADPRYVIVNQAPPHTIKLKVEYFPQPILSSKALIC